MKHRRGLPLWPGRDLGGLRWRWMADIYVANDSSPGLLYHNNEGKSFTEVAVTAGVAFSDDGREQAGMGVDFGDYDTMVFQIWSRRNFSDDANNLYHNNGDGNVRRSGRRGRLRCKSAFRFLGLASVSWTRQRWLERHSCPPMGM